MLLQLADKLQEHKDNISKLKTRYISDNAKMKELNDQILKLERTQKVIHSDFDPLLKDIDKLDIEANHLLNIIQENNKNMDPKIYNKLRSNATKKEYS